MSLDLSITGHRTALPQRKSRSAYRFKAANSYVDETLFGSSVARAEQTLQWSPVTPRQKPLLWSPVESTETTGSANCRTNCTPTRTPRKKVQYRVKSRCPSYCDESLFGQRLEECSWEAPWVKKEDTIKLRPLLWSPPSLPVTQNSKQNTKQLPLRAVHPPEVSDRVLGTPKRTGDFWKPLESDSDSGGYSSTVTARSVCAKPNWDTPGRETVRSASWSGRVTARRGSGKMQERPPWK
ncbi:RBPJ-interacting and tubulin-associated protein 1 [Rhinophrynus dorsalis]